MQLKHRPCACSARAWLCLELLCTLQTRANEAAISPHGSCSLSIAPVHALLKPGTALSSSLELLCTLIRRAKEAAISPRGLSSLSIALVHALLKLDAALSSSAQSLSLL